jgi:hypothetical protein
MEHVAIDLGGRKSQICIRIADGTIVQERLVPNELLSDVLKGRPKSRVVLKPAPRHSRLRTRPAWLGTRFAWCQPRWSRAWESERDEPRRTGEMHERSARFPAESICPRSTSPRWWRESVARYWPLEILSSSREYSSSIACEGGHGLSSYGYRAVPCVRFLQR